MVVLQFSLLIQLSFPVRRLRAALILTLILQSGWNWVKLFRRVNVHGERQTPGCWRLLVIQAAVQGLSIKAVLRNSANFMGERPGSKSLWNKVSKKRLRLRCFKWISGSFRNTAFAENYLATAWKQFNHWHFEKCPTGLSQKYQEHFDSTTMRPHRTLLYIYPKWYQSKAEFQ